MLLDDIVLDLLQVLRIVHMGSSPSRICLREDNPPCSRFRDPYVGSCIRFGYSIVPDQSISGQDEVEVLGLMDFAGEQRSGWQ